MSRTGDRPISRLAHGRVVAITVSAVTLASVGLGAAVAIPSAAASTSICVSAPHPLAAGRMSSRISTVLAGRPHSVVGLYATDSALGISCAVRSNSRFYSASVVKVTILSALLLKVGGVGHLTSTQRNLASAMITQSSNTAASTLFSEVGMTSMQTFLNKAGMRQTVLSSAWGLTQITPHDELILLRLLSYPGTLLSTTSRNYVLTLMAQVISSQRWGVSAGAPAGVTVHIKNGWLPYPNSSDWRVNSIGEFTSPKFNYQMVVLTAPAAGGQSYSYGVQTIQAIASLINANIAGLQAIFGRG